MNPSPGAESPMATEASVERLIAIIVSRRRLILAAALGVATLVALVILVRGRSYSASMSFIAQSRRAGAALSGLAAQLGLNVPGAEAGQSPQFYADLVRGRQVLGAAAAGEFVGDDGAKITLAEALGVEEDSPEETREAVIRELGARVFASANTRTGVVRVTGRFPQRTLARDVVARLVDLLNEFNLKTRQTAAVAEREFTESRLRQAKEELRSAEDDLQGFLQRNRDYRSSPQLTFAADRLEREVTVRQQVVSTLAQAFEQARIEEVRDTPVITVIEAAEAPVRADPRRLVVMTALSLFGGGVLGIALALGLAARDGWRGRHA